MNEVIREFILETQENLATLDIDLVTLEKDPTERETLARIFRTLHTVKGTAGFLGLMKLQAVAHTAENLLSRLTAGDLTFSPEIASALLATVDTIRKMLDAIEKTEQEGDGDYSALIQTLDRLRTADQAKGPRKQSLTSVPVFPTTPPKVEKPVPVPEPVARKPERQEPATPPKVERPAAARAEQVDPSPLTPPGPLDMGSVLVDSEPLLVDAGSEYALKNGSENGTHSAPPPAPSKPETPDRLAAEPVKAHVPTVSDSAIRVDVGLLDKLMTLVGELVLARNQIVQLGAGIENPAFQDTVQRLNGLTTELQANVMKTRMQPIGRILSKFDRLARDMALACNKQIVFEIVGRDTELDKTIIEAIRDPLIHMLRNAIDHGIEPPAERKKRGKPEEGRVRLTAFHEGGKVIIEVEDDGGGIDPQRVRKKAIQAKLITAEQANQMSKRELLNLIFTPGFSTADKVTHFSGRGVGMNVVHANLEAIGGTVDIDTVVGLGTTFKIKIPLTLAIIPALTITTGGDCYAIPQINLLELVRIDAEDVERRIENVHGAPVYRLRGNLLPVIDLNEQLEIESPRCNGAAKCGINMVVLQADDRPFGLIVDEIHDTQEIVVKPLQKPLKGLNVFAGATIMGDGKVSLILDVLGLAQRANVVSNARERTAVEKPKVDEDSDEPRLTVILFDAPGHRRMAVPLSEVARIEEWPRSYLDKLGNQDVITFRGELLTLIDVSRALGISHDDRQGVIDGIAWQKDAADTVQFILYSWEGRLIGLVVGRVLDIVEDVLVSPPRVNQPCVLLTAVIDGRATEILDIDGLIRLANPEFYEQREAIAEEV